jgi:hypothetical protein
MNGLNNELSAEIFKHVNTPMSLVLTNRKWNSISQTPHARANWLIHKYGRAHALFHAVRLGNEFLTFEVLKSLLSKKAIISRYFIQRLLMHYGTYDHRLIDLKIRYNINQVELEKLRVYYKKSSLWASNLPLSIFTYLVDEAGKTYGREDTATRGNDMELFHFLSAVSLPIHLASSEILKNVTEINDLIIVKNFIPFPPCPRAENPDDHFRLQEERSREAYPRKDGFENSRQLNVISRAIIIYPELVNAWKKIGYNICNDINDLVIGGLLLILFPPNPPAGWERPDKDTIVERLRVFTRLGFG